jgi:hypothetical protein
VPSQKVSSRKTGDHPLALLHLPTPPRPNPLSLYFFSFFGGGHFIWKHTPLDMFCSFIIC